MTLVTIPTCPAVRWWKVRPRLNSPSQQTESEWTGHRKVQPSGRFWWTFSVDLPAMDEDMARKWRSFFGKMQGRANTFQLPVVRESQSAASCLVAGAGQTGYTLNVDGLGAAGTKLTEGKYATVGGQLMLLGSDLVADAGGAGTITFVNPLRSSPADNAVVTISTPYATCSMASDDLGWDVEFSALTHGFAFDCREAF